MEFTAAQISFIVNGKIEGDPDAKVNSFGKIEEAGPLQITFLSNSKYEDHLYHTKASVAIINNNFELKKPVSCTVIRVEDARKAFIILLAKYKELTTQQLKGIQQPSYISESAQLGENIFVGTFSFIGSHVKIGNNTKIFQNCTIADNVQIGENCVIYPGVKIYEDCIVGNHAIIHAGVVIGSDGFGFVPLPDGSNQKVPHIGNVVIEDHVEIGANTTIDRATMGSTLIKTGVKLDNLVQVGHNVQIGDNTVIAALTGIGGSARLGKNMVVGGQVGISDHVDVADGTKVGAQAKLVRSVTRPNTVLNDSPAFEYIKSIKSQLVYRNLPELEKRVSQLEQLLKNQKGTD